MIAPSRRGLFMGMGGAMAGAMFLGPPALAAKLKAARTAYDFTFRAIEGGPLPLYRFHLRLQSSPQKKIIFQSSLPSSSKPSVISQTPLTLRHSPGPGGQKVSMKVLAPQDSVIFKLGAQIAAAAPARARSNSFSN